MDISSKSNVRADHFIIQAVAGETLSANDAVYISSSDGKAYQCDADDLTKIGFVGFCLAATSTGSMANIKAYGHVDGFSSLTIGGLVYLSGTAGAVTQTKPSNFKLVGRAVSATTIDIITSPTKHVRTYTSSTSWTKPGGLRYIEVEVQGGGAGGSGTSGNTDASGGGGGGYSKKTIYAGDLSSSETVTVGAAGTAGSSSPTVGGAGGNSSFGSHATANGGSAAAVVTGNGGAGGTASGGDINITGQGGGYGASNSGTAGGTRSGHGGSSMLGIAAYQGSNGAGSAGTGYGAGGAGGHSTSGSGYAGGAGTQGVVIVTEYY